MDRPLDTSEEAWAMVRSIHSRLGPEGRVEAAFAASEMIREAVRAGILLRHPGWDERQLRGAVLERFYGSALAARVLGAAGSKL